MRHAVFALFDDAGAADRAIGTLVEVDRHLRSHMSLVVHRDVVNEAALEELVQHAAGADETDASHGRFLGATLGATVGSVFGALLAGPLGILAGGPLAGVLFGAGAGTLHGLLASGLVGSGLTDHTLKKLAARIQAGDVLVTVQTPDRETETRVTSLLRGQGATVAEKHLV